MTGSFILHSIFALTYNLRLAIQKYINDAQFFFSNLNAFVNKKYMAGSLILH